MSDQKLIPDWIKIEVDFRAGMKPLRQIAEENGVSHVAVSKRAKKLEWSRDLAAKIKAQADIKVNKAVVTKSVNKAETLVTEKSVIEANAEVQFRIRMEHRTDIGRNRKLFGALLGELEDATEPEGKRLLEELMQLMTKPEEDADEEELKEAGKRAARMRALFNKTLDMSGRIDSAKKLAEMLERLIKMEREAFGIDDTEKGDSGIEAVLKKLGSQE